MSYMPPPGPHPGQYGYGGMPASPYYGVTRAYRPTRGLAVALLVLLSIMGLLSFVRVFAHIDRASLLDDVRDGEIGVIGMVAEVDDADSSVAGATFLWVLGVLATGVVFIVWQYRHASNAQVLRGGDGGLGPGWAIGGWFIPLANFVLPCIQIFGSSRPSDPRLPPQSMQRGAGSSIVVCWAVVYGVAGCVQGLGSIIYPGSEELRFDDALSDAIAADRLMGLGSLLYVVAAVLAAVMVWQLTNRQDRRAAGQGLVPGLGQVAAAGQVWQSTLAAPAPAPAWGAPPPQQPAAQPAPAAPPPAPAAPPPPQPPSPPVPSEPPAGPWAPPGQTPG